MKTKYFLSILVVVSISAWGNPCGNQLGHPHQNPDNTAGGFVAKTARVSETAFIDSTSSVCDQVQILGNIKVSKNSVISDKAKIEGRAQIVSSNISGAANISGSSIISNSQVCQESQISGFNVVNSDYYCQTGDPAPKDPGDSANLTALGVDSDADGVRDDVEILINNLTSNTPTMDYKDIRKISKDYARILQKEVLHRSNKKKLGELLLEKTNILACGEIVHESEIFEKMYNTEERLYALFKIVGSFHGEEVISATRKCAPNSKFRLNK